MGLPPTVRGRIWMLCLGNRFSITKEYYQIQVNNSKEILKKYQKIKEKNNQKNKNNDKDKDKNNKINESDEESNNIDKELESKDKEKTIIVIELDIERTFPILDYLKVIHQWLKI